MLCDIKIPIQNKLISFFHIPKTAGTNFTYVIKNNYKHCYINKKKFYAIDKKTRKKVCTWGHGGYQNCLEHDSIMFLFLRDPVERVVSHYIENKINAYIAKDFTLEEMFLENPEIYVSDISPHKRFRKRSGMYQANWGKNFYCRALSGYSYEEQEPYIITSDIKNNIIGNIKNNTIILKNKYNLDVEIPVVIGITERFNDSLKLFAKIAGWKTIEYKELSKNRAYNGGKRRYDASDELLQAIRDVNTFDIEIYEEAKRVFENQLKYFGIE